MYPYTGWGEGHCVHRMVFSARFFILWMIFLLVSGPASAQTRIKPEPVGDTALLPFGLRVIQEMNTNGLSKTSAHSIRVLRPAYNSSDTAITVQVVNSSLNQDDAASVFVNTFPANRTISQDPIFLTIKDFFLFKDSLGHDGVALLGYRNDTAYLARNFPGSNHFDLLLLATGIDQTGNGQWEPSPYFLTSFDYDFDGDVEYFFFLMCGRDKRPRIYFCVDIGRLAIEWSLPMASSPTPDNTLNCADSADPGILVCSYGPENGVTDQHFDDRYGYVTRINQRGEVVFNHQIAPKFSSPLLLPFEGDSLYLLYHTDPLPGETKGAAPAWLSVLDGRGAVRRNVSVPLVNASAALVDIVGSTKPELLMIGQDGRGIVYDQSLSPVYQLEEARFGQYLSNFRLPGTGELVLQFATEYGSVLYTAEWECRGVLPGVFGEVLPAAYDSTGGVAMFVSNSGSGFQAYGLEARPWSQRTVAFLWRYRNWFVLALVLVTVQLVIMNIRRRRALEALRTVEARNEAMLAASPDLMFRLTTDGVFLDYRASHLDELYAPVEQFVGRNLKEVLPSPLVDQVQAAVAEVVAHGTCQTVEYQIPVAGVLMEYEARLVLSRPDEVLAIVRNITEQKKSQQALRESEHNFRLFFDSIGDMVLVASREGRLLLTNSRLQSNLGYTAEELSGMQIIDLHPGPMRQEASRIFESIIRGDADLYSLPLVRRDGTEIPVATRIWSGQWNGADCLFGLCEDLTERQEAESRFQQLFQLNPALMALTDAETGRFVDVNTAFLQTLGLTRSEVIDRTATELGIFPEAERHREASRTLRETGRISNVELMVRRKDGRQLTGLFSGEPIIGSSKSYYLTVMTDLTLQRQANDELRASREFLQLLLDSIPARVFWKDLNGRYLGCNTQFARDAGVASPEEVVGQDDFALAWRAQAELYRADDRAVIESGQAKMLIEEPQTTPTGAIIHLLTSKVPLRGLDGTIMGVLGTYQDITELKAAEQALRESEEKYRSLSEHSNIGILQYDDKQVLFVNEQLAQLLEVDIARLLGITIPELLEVLVGKDAVQAWTERIRGRLAGESVPHQFEAEITTFKGTRKRIEALARRIVLPNRVFVQATWLDISARYRIEQSLRESEAKFRAVAESMTAGITIFGRDRLLYCNPASVQITGFTQEELLKMNYFDIVHPDFRDLVKQRGRERLSGADVPPRYEVKIVCKNGEERWIDYSAQLVEFMGDTCILGTTIDITDRVHAENELQRIYQERYQQVREIAGGVSHEIYNSLFPATTSLYKLRERVQQQPLGNEEKEREMRLLGLAEQAIARAIHMTESVTSYSRLEASRRIEEVPVRELVGEIVEQNRGRCESHQIQIVVAVPEQARVACSRPHFNSLVNNLVVNAIDALQETEHPSISITAAMTKHMVTVRVADNGSGIAAENLPRIFDAFFSTKPRSGTGIGLAMARKIAEMYGGSLKVTSAPNAGTSFEIVLPRYRPEEGERDATQ